VVSLLQSPGGHYGSEYLEIIFVQLERIDLVIYVERFPVKQFVWPESLDKGRGLDGTERCFGSGRNDFAHNSMSLQADFENNYP
jgi:hypothetical protein